MIRQLTPQDAEDYKFLRLSSLKSDPISFLSIYESEKNFPTDYFLRKIQFSQKGNFGYWGYFEDDKLIATAQIADSGVYKKRHIIGLYELYVDPKKRRSGIATKLIKHIIKAVKTFPEAEQIQLKVNSRNLPALTFYEKLGFKKIGNLPNTVKEPDGSYQDELVYCLYL